ncbi:hypothetical protein BDR04DRAFT_1227574 [Suillus decipiens]|nr:hypothetical protein BDR04DRAFT_1227574 [Suillus decipiens]
MSNIMSYTTPATSLKISPDLEALLQQDELIRRASGSPTNSVSHPSGFAVSLAPPPPRNTVKKTANYENRVKEIRRKKINVRSDSWPDALKPAMNSPVGYSSPASAAPNPYINPTPVAPTINTFDAGPISALSLRNGHADSTETMASLPRKNKSEPDVYHTTDPPVHLMTSSRSSPTLQKVEKIFTKGRESLSILTSVAIPSNMKPKQDDHVDFRPHRTELVDSGAYQSSLSVPQVRQGRESGYQAMSHQLSAFGDTETASISNASSWTTETQQFSPVRTKSPFSTGAYTGGNSPSASSSRSLPNSGYLPSAAAISSNLPSTYHASSLPHLPPISPIEMPLLPSLQKRASNDQQSFIDFFLSSPVSPPMQDDPSIISDRRPSTPAILSSSIYSSTSRNSSLNDLPCMVFAPASPTSIANEVLDSPQHSRPSSSASSRSDVSAMIFAPTSPTSGPYLSPISYRPDSPCSSTTSLATPEFAPPSPAFPYTTDTLKPPVSTSPKPPFEKRGRKTRLQKRSLSSSPRPPFRLKVPLPPTTNTLDANERADLIRRNRKLVQLLGQTPAVEIAASGVEESRLFKMLPQPPFSALLGSVKQKHHRHALSVSVAVKTPGFKSEPSSSWQVIDCPSAQNGRRYSTPHTPRSFTFYLDDSPEPPTTHDHHGPHRHWDPQHQYSSSTSFIDLSDEDNSHDPSDAINIDMPNTANGRRIFHHSSSTPSVVETFTPEEQAEAERRRKRDKLAKLHRFLGSRVPTDLVIGHIAGPSLPPSPVPLDGHDMWLYRRRSGSSAPSFERVKTELDDEEKALNVKRAQKMEKLFGTPPPQTLFHTRHAPATVARSQPASPVASLMIPTYVPPNASGFSRRNPNQSAYMKGKKVHRPGTSESTAFLLPIKCSSSPEPGQATDYLDTLAQSSVYMNYQHSIASLTEIIDRDDRASLAELHRFLHSDLVDSPTEEQPLLESHRISGSSYSFKSERRHSLPTRTSMASIATEIPVSSPKGSSDFQLRRRRAAKLTHFFGVDYRELIHDILTSIEKGVEEERKRGTLRPEEVESLLHKLHKLRTRQDELL